MPHVGKNVVQRTWGKTQRRIQLPVDKMEQTSINGNKGETRKRRGGEEVTSVVDKKQKQCG